MSLFSNIKRTNNRCSKRKRIKTVEDVNEAIDAGSACGGCNDEIQEIIDSVNG